MAQRKPLVRGIEANPVYEELKGCVHTTVSVGTTAVQVPTTNLSYRKEITIQNIHASNIVYVGSSIPDIITSNDFTHVRKAGYDHMGASIKELKWNLSAGGTTEYYATTTAGGDPGLTEPLRMYGITASGGAEAILTNGTVASLNNLEWDWGDGDTLGYNTIYLRHNSGNPSSLGYIVLLSYTKMPDSSSTYGVKLGPNDSYSGTYGATARLFAIASGASTNVVVLESL